MRVQVGDVRLFFDVDGAKLRPADSGLEERPTVLILHAGPGLDHAPYKETLGPRLVDLAQVVYLDQRGHGRSDRSDAASWNLTTWASDVKGFCDRLRIERPVILGQGWGARIVPDRSIAVFERLGGAAAGEAAFQFYRHPSERTVADFLRVCFPLLGRKERGPGTLLRAHWNFEALIEWQLHEGHEVDLRPEAAQVTAPTLVLQGEDDPQMPLVGALELADQLPDARIVTYQDGRHSLFHDEPAAADEVLEWVRS